MSSIVDVERAVLALVNGALFPSGTATGSSAAGLPVKTYRGWPQVAELNGDVRATPPGAHVVVNRQPGMAKNATKYLNSTITTTNAIGITAAVSGSSVTYAGTATAAQVVGIMARSVGYAVQIAAGATAAQAAAAIAARINEVGDVTASVSGAVVTLSSPVEEAPVGATGAVATIRATVSCGINVTIFAPSRDAADALEGLLIPALLAPAAISLPDGGYPLLLEGAIQNDAAENADVYRRDIIVSTYYNVTTSEDTAQALFIGGILSVKDYEAAFLSIDPLPGFEGLPDRPFLGSR